MLMMLTLSCNTRYLTKLFTVNTTAMITQKDITGLEFETIEQYYEYIIESYLNGQRGQAKRLFLKGTNKQRKIFLWANFLYDFMHKIDVKKERMFYSFWNLM